MRKRGSVRGHGSGGWAALAAAMLSAAPEARSEGNLPARSASKFHPDSSFDAELLLRGAAAQAKGGQWPEAIDRYRKVIENFGESVALVPKVDAAAGANPRSRVESTLHVDARDYCQRQIAAMPAEARALYRTRVDPEAGRWFRDGSARRDPEELRKVVSRAFCSSWGDDAADLLGDLAFQDGRFGDALTWYRRVVDDPSSPGGGGLVHPDPSVDLARVAAKAILCRVAVGEEPPTAADLASYRRTYPAASGRLAGREGLFADLVEAALADDHLASPASADGRWSTFAGGPTRTRVAPAAVDVGSFQWSARLEPAVVGQRSMMGNGFGMIARPQAAQALVAQSLAYHPIVLGDQVVVADANRIAAYPLGQQPSTTAEPPKLAWDQRVAAALEGAMRPANQVGSIPRYTLTAAGDRIFARLGAPGVRGGPPATIVAVRNNRDVEGKLLWRKTAAEVEIPRRVGAGRGGASFEGTPVADAERVYVAMTESGPMTATYVACLDAETGVTRWVRFVGEASTGLDAGMGFNNAMPADDSGRRLLSLDGPSIYYQTNLGAVAALDAATGAVRWVASYPSQDGFGEGRTLPRDLNPAVVHDGLVVVAPDDSPNLFAFQAATGRLAWRSPELPNVAHLLGVAKGRVVATGDRVYTLDLKTGDVLTRFPEGSPGNQEPLGRGVMAGGQIYWPTRQKIWVLDQATGAQAEGREPIDLGAYGVGGGNLAVGDGYLVVAQAEALVVFCQNSRLIRRYREEIAQGRDPAANALRLARVAEATGQDGPALDALAESIRRAGPSEAIDGQPVAEAARRQQYLLLMKLGARAVAAGKWAEAAPRFGAAADSATADKDRLAARLSLARAQAGAGDPASSVATLQGLLADARLRGLAVADDGGQRVVRADLLVADRLFELIDKHGRGLYAAYDRRADELLGRGRAERSPRTVEEIGRSYPAARILPESLVVLAGLHESLAHPADAARAFRRLLAGRADDDHRARALVGLGRAYEAQRLWGPARDAYARALAGHPEVRLDEFGAGATVRSIVAGRLARPPFDRVAEGRAEPTLSVPLARLWERSWADAGARPLAVDGAPPSAAAAPILLVDRHEVRSVDPATGAPGWSFDLKAVPIWAGYLADRLLVASGSRVVALAPETGAVSWDFDASAGGPRRPRGVDPFARARAGAGAGPEEDASLSDPRIVGGRVLCVRGRREVLALDGDTGQLDWSYPAGDGTLGPRSAVGPRRAVFQLRRKGGNAILAIEVENGRCRSYPRPDDDPEWPRDPAPIDDDHVALAIDARRVASFDLERGREAWVHTHEAELPYTGPPRLIVDSGRLLALFDGGTLQRLDPATGATLWSAGLGAEDLSEAAEALVVGGDRVYSASGTALTAHSMADGAPAWRRRLTGPEAGWALALTDRCVLAYPSPGRAPNREMDALPIVLCRRLDGAPVQRLLLRASVRDLTIRLGARGALVASQDRLWALGDRPAMDGPGAGR